MKQKLPLADALPIAESLLNVLTPVCERIMIAGSLRRQKPEIGDIELVLIPEMEPIFDLFGETIGYESQLEPAIRRIGMLTRNGNKYKQFWWQGVQADLFICTPETWGCIATIRTGSADFTQWLVTSKGKGGACPGHLAFKDGRIWEMRLNPLDTPEEADVFGVLGLDWVAPEERLEGRWKR